MTDKDLLLQLQRWIAKQLQSADFQVPLNTARQQHPEDSVGCSISELRDQHEDAAMDSLTQGTETDAEIITVLEQLRLQLLCEQDLILTEISKSSSVSNEEDNTADEAMLERRRRAEEIAATRCPMAVALAKAEQKRLRDTGSEEPSNEHIPSHVKNKWQQLKAQTLRRCNERIAASKAEGQAHQMIRAFAQEHGDVAYLLAGEWIEMVRRHERLGKHLFNEEADCTENFMRSLKGQAIDQVRRKILEDEQARQTEREAFRAECIAEMEAELALQASFLGKSPGYHATMYKDATEPCSKWAAPNIGLRLERQCKVCGLTGVERTDDCLNYFQHWKWLDGLLEVYNYDEYLKKE